MTRLSCGREETCRPCSNFEGDTEIICIAVAHVAALPWTTTGVSLAQAREDIQQALEFRAAEDEAVNHRMVNVGLAALVDLRRI